MLEKVKYGNKQALEVGFIFNLFLIDIACQTFGLSEFVATYKSPYIPGFFLNIAKIWRKYCPTIFICIFCNVGFP